MYHPKDRHINILIASSWTGGHVFPGICISEELKKNIHKANIIFVTSKKDPAPKILRRYKYKTIFLNVEGIKGKTLIKRINTILKLPVFLIQSLRIIKKNQPCIVVGLGGSICGPICIASKIMGIPFVIHEQNLFPGFTNRFLYPFADKVFISFKNTNHILRGKHVIFSGNPVRQEFFSIEKEKNNIFTVLIVGGSQGSHAINNASLEALQILKKGGKRLNIIHQTGVRDFQEVKHRYKNFDLNVKIIPFIEDMVSAIKKADIVISRAGASSIFELSASKTPAILIPYPHSADQHQQKNALFLAKLGAIELIPQNELTGLRLANSIKRYMDNPEKLERMRHKFSLIAKPNSANIISDHIMEILKI